MYINDLLQTMSPYNTLSIWRVWYDEFGDVQWEIIIKNHPEYRKSEVPDDLKGLKIEIIDATVNHIDVGVKEW